VTGLEGARLCHARHDLVISLVDPGLRLPWRHPRHHVFRLLDWDEADAPGMADLRAILALDLSGLRSVLIHCHYGFSRSPAVAMLLARRLLAPLPAIEAGIDWERASPNRRILAMGEPLLGPDTPLRDIVERRLG
jgi:predicted protein tyrosine phosphatase